MNAKKPSYETPSNPIPNVVTFFLVLVMAGSLLRAEVTIDPLFSGSFTEVDSATQLNYAADVSSADLLHGLTATTTGWKFSAGATPANLNDGAHGTSPDVVGNAAIATVAWTTVGATAEYELGTGSNGTGYDITSIQSIADWGGAGFGNQGYTVEVKRVAGSYVTLATVDFQPLPLSGAGTTKVSLTGLDPSGIEFIRFTANSVNGGANVGAFTFREIDVLGTDTAALGPDSTPPTVSILSPVDDITAVLRGDNLVITFDENIELSSGNITIKNLDTPTQTVIPVADAQISVNGAVLTIDPSTNLAGNTNYAIQIAATAIIDSSGNPFAGILDDTTWNFRTGSTPLRIMPLGDSITAGYTDNPRWANHQFMFGYRSGLYTRLTNAGYDFLFVGTSPQPLDGLGGDLTHGGRYTAGLDLRTFGQDGHRGYGGHGITPVINNVVGYMTADNPDIILLLIGINGLGTGSQGALDTLVNTIVTTDPSVQLIVAQITPLVSFNQALHDYNVYIRDVLVPTYVGNGYNVSTADLYSLFLSDPSDYSSAIEAGVLANNFNHPDNPHYDLMAQRWFEAIEALGLGPSSFSSWIAAPAFGLAPADQNFGDNPDGDSIVNGVESWFGTQPEQFESGLAIIATDGTVSTFSHPLNLTTPSDVSGTYEWSPNLADWYSSGNGPGGNPIVTMVPNTVGTTTTVTATASQVLARIFLRVRVNQN